MYFLWWKIILTDDQSILFEGNKNSFDILETRFLGVGTKLTSEVQLARMDVFESLVGEFQGQSPAVHDDCCNATTVGKSNSTSLCSGECSIKLSGRAANKVHRS